jgi:hypothetical protein
MNLLSSLRYCNLASRRKSNLKRILYKTITVLPVGVKPLWISKSSKAPKILIKTSFENKGLYVFRLY